MSIESEIFQRSTPDFSKLIPYGFTLKKDHYFYTKDIMQGDFRVEVSISTSGEIIGKVYDLLTESEYANVHIARQQGEFVNTVRESYREVLIDIREHCFIKTPFIFKQTNRLSQYIKKQFDVTPNFPWATAPGAGVFRNNQNNKWFGIVTYIAKSKLDPTASNKNQEEAKKRVEVINLKLDKDKIPTLLKKEGFYPAYHMNKTYWISIILDETVADTEIIPLLNESYQASLQGNKSGKLTRSDAPKEWVIPANMKYFDVIKAFKERDEITWKQGADIRVGDTVFLYLGTPVSAILYKCLVTEINLPPREVGLKPRMKIKRQHIFEQSDFPFKTLKKYGVNAVRGPRGITEALSKAIQQTITEGDKHDSNH